MIENDLGHWDIRIKLVMEVSAAFYHSQNQLDDIIFKWTERESYLISTPQPCRCSSAVEVGSVDVAGCA